MKTYLKPLFLLSSCALAAISSLNAGAPAAVATDPVGYISIPCLGGSDTIVSLPLTDATVAASTVVSTGVDTVTIALGTMTVDQYKDSHFVRFGEASGLEGAKMTISANTADTLTVDVPSGYALGTLTAGDVAEIIPHTTLSQLFSSVATFPDETEVFFFENAVNGINKSSAGGYIYFAPDWYDADTFDAVNGAVLFPDDALVVRVPGGASEDFTITVAGTVPVVGHSFSVVTAAAGANDNFISPQVPAEVEIATLFSSPSDGDEILIFDNTVRAQNKSSAGGYIYFAPDWYDADTFDVVNTLTVKPWEVAVYRRSDQSGASATVFSGRASYLDNL
jgi:uncharacterized protein (TIGR02597 family)